MEINMETLQSLITMMTTWAHDAERKANALRKSKRAKRSRVREAEGTAYEYEYILGVLTETLASGPASPRTRYVLFIFVFKDMWGRLEMMLRQLGAMEGMETATGLGNEEVEEHAAYLRGRIHAHYCYYKTFLDDRIHETREEN